MLHSKLSVGAAFMCLAAFSFATPSPVGKWTGHIHITPSAAATAQQKQQLAQFMSMTAKTHVVLTFKADHTFVSDVSGMGGNSQHKSGKWTQKADAVTMVTPQGTQVFKFAAGGKSLIFTLPSRQGMSGEVTFTR